MSESTGETPGQPSETQPAAADSPPSAAASDDGAWGAAELSADQADALASRFRASWEDAGPDPEPHAVGSVAAPATAAPATADPAVAPATKVADRWVSAPAPIAAAALAAPATAHIPQTAPSFPAQPAAAAVAAEPRRRAYSSEAELPALPMVKTNRLFVLGGIGVVVVLGIVVLSVTLSGGSTPPAGSSRTDAPQTASAAPEAAPTPDPTPTPAPAPTPVAAVQPPAPAPAPVAVAPAPAPVAVAPVPAPAPVAVAPAPAPIAARVATPPPAPVAPPPPPMVRVRLRATPSTAQISVDGTRVSNPTDARFPRSAGHRIDVTADGYTAATRSLSFDRDVSETFALVRVPVAATPTPRAQPRARPRPRPRARPAGHARPAPRGAGFVTDNPY